MINKNGMNMLPIILITHVVTWASIRGTRTIREARSIRVGPI